MRLNTLMLAGLAGAFSVSAAQAGECPADQIREGSVTEGPSAPVGEADTLLEEISLTEFGLEGAKLRLRRVTVEKDGKVPFHPHGRRPAIIHIIKGEIVEHRSNCAVPIVHKAGDVVAEGGDYSHWWENKKRKKVVIYSSDVLLPAESGDHM